MLALAGMAGLQDAPHVSTGELTEHYFVGRPDCLRPSSTEHLLVATV
jgi:hypothetical protein